MSLKKRNNISLGWVSENKGGNIIMCNHSSSSVWQQHLLKNAGYLKLAGSLERLVWLKNWAVS